MTIKPECVIKHVKKDYVDIGKTIGYIAASSVALVAGVYSCNAAYQFGLPTLSYLGSLCTAYNLFVVATVIIAGASTVLLAIFGNKELLTAKKSVMVTEGFCTESKVVADPITASDVIIFAAMLETVLVGFYIVLGWAATFSHDNIPVFPSVNMVLLVFTIYILIATPICCAIARCKE